MGGVAGLFQEVVVLVCTFDVKIVIQFPIGVENADIQETDFGGCKGSGKFDGRM